MALAMDCYVNNVVVCRVKNGQEEVCYVEDNIIDFKCALPHNPMSETVSIDARNGDDIRILIKQTGWKPEVKVQNANNNLTKGNQNMVKENVFSAKCVLCDKSMNFFNGKIILKDGYVCNKCWNANGLNKRINYMTESRNYSTSQIRDMVKTIKSAPTNTSVFQTNTLISDLIQLDDETQTVQIITKPGFNSAKEYLRYDQIVSFELIEDGETVTKGGLGGALVGGAMFGMGGAIVGSVIAPKKTKPICDSLEIRIAVKDYYTKAIFVKYIETPTKSTSTTYKEMYDKARKAIAELQVAVSMVGEKQDKAETVGETSLAGELERLQSLYEKGILSEEEFAQAKKKALGL